MNKEEHYIQKSICQYLDLAQKQLDFEYYAVPNGGLRNIRVAAQLKAEGVKAGVSDLVLLFSYGKSFYAEVKTKTGKQSDSQKDFQQRIERLGFAYLLWRSVDEIGRAHV